LEYQNDSKYLTAFLVTAVACRRRVWINLAEWDSFLHCWICGITSSRMIPRNWAKAVHTYWLLNVGGHLKAFYIVFFCKTSFQDFFLLARRAFLSSLKLVPTLQLNRTCHWRCCQETFRPMTFFSVTFNIWRFVQSCVLRFHDYWDQFIWDHSFETIHLRPFIRDHVHLGPRSFQTTFIWDLFIWDHFIWDHVHLRSVNLRPQSFETFSFETTFIWDRNHLRPQSFETTSFKTTFIWDHIHLRPHSFESTSFETTFIWDHIHLRPLHLRPHSF